MSLEKSKFDNARVYVFKSILKDKLTKLFLVFLFIHLGCSISFSQYFGRNKVQYEDFDFQILHTENFDIYHYLQEADAIKDFGRLSERWYLCHSSLLNHTFQKNNPLIIYSNHADFQQTDITPNISLATGGVTEGLRNRVIMPFAQANVSTNHV